MSTNSNTKNSKAQSNSQCGSKNATNKGSNCGAAKNADACDESK